MSEFGPAVALVLHHEGGYVDDPDDPGGETNYGISRLIIREAKLTHAQLGLDNLEPGALNGLTVDVARQVYRREFWDGYPYGDLRDQRVASKIFDAAVNMGSANAHRCAQKAAVDLGATIGNIDGMLGPVTVAGINDCDGDAYLVALSAELRGYYERLLAARPELEKFRLNWFHRARWPQP